MYRNEQLNSVLKDVVDDPKVVKIAITTIMRTFPGFNYETTVVNVNPGTMCEVKLQGFTVDSGKVLTMSFSGYFGYSDDSDTLYCCDLIWQRSERA